MNVSFVKPIARFLSRQGRVDFQPVHDPRARRGRRWSKQALLGTLLLGFIAVERTLRDVESLTQRLGALGRALGIHKRLPDSTLALFLSRLTDEQGLRRCLVNQVRAAERRKALGPVRLPINMVVVDNKTVWCSRKKVDPQSQKASHDGFTTYNLRYVNAVLASAASQPCIDRRVIPAKTNECGVFPEFFKQLVKTYGRGSFLELISNDAGITSADNARLVNDAGVGYLMAVKGDQPTLFEEAQRLLGTGAKKQAGYVCEAKTPWERYKGKRIRRELFRCRFEGWPNWESARQLWRVKQTTETPDGERTVENRYFVTNLTWGRLKPLDILAVVRAHWAIEDGLHWTLDVVLREDKQVWCKQGKAVRMLSWVRAMAYNALRLLRDRHLRSDDNRHRRWSDLKRDIVAALQAPSLPRGTLGAEVVGITL
jgi:predicted transposase YbfD/YdcC